MTIKILVVVEGGCVQAVASSDPNVEVELLDRDNLVAAEEGSDERRELEALTDRSADFATSEWPHVVF